MEPRRSRRLRQSVKNARVAIHNNRGWTTVWGLWFIMQGFSLGYKTLSVPLLLSVYRFFGRGAPPIHSHSPWLPVWNWAYTQLLFWPLIGFLYLVVKVFTFRRKSLPVVARDPVVLYEDEIAAALFAIDNARDDANTRPEMKKAIVALLDMVTETIAVNLRLRKKDYRLYLVVPNLDTSTHGLLSGFRVGRAFEDARKGKLGTSEFQTLLEKDSARVQTFLTEYGTAVCFTKLDGDEKAVLMMARNPGKYLRLGLYLAVTKPGADIDDYRDTFVEVAAIVSTLGFIDEIVECVREYGREGGASR